MVYVTRPGLAIGRRGTGIKDLTDRVAKRFGFPNPQIAVSEVQSPELNPRIMAARIAQIVARGTAFRRAATWTMNTIMGAGAMGVEISVAGKLRSDRSHSEKYRMGIVPKSGETSTRIVREAGTDVLMKLGLYGINVKIAIKNAIPPIFELKEEAQTQEAAQPTPPPQVAPIPVATPVPQVPAKVEKEVLEAIEADETPKEAEALTEEVAPPAEEVAPPAEEVAPPNPEEPTPKEEKIVETKSEGAQTARPDAA
jgi:small subunit ribosomal protein S3